MFLFLFVFFFIFFFLIICRFFFPRFTSTFPKPSPRTRPTILALVHPTAPPLPLVFTYSPRCCPRSARTHKKSCSQKGNYTTRTPISLPNVSPPKFCYVVGFLWICVVLSFPFLFCCFFCGHTMCLGFVFLFYCLFVSVFCYCLVSLSSWFCFFWFFFSRCCILSTFFLLRYSCLCIDFFICIVI